MGLSDVREVGAFYRLVLGEKMNRSFLLEVPIVEIVLLAVVLVVWDSRVNYGSTKTCDKGRTCLGIIAVSLGRLHRQRLQEEYHPDSLVEVT